MTKKQVLALAHSHRCKGCSSKQLLRSMDREAKIPELLKKTRYGALSHQCDTAGVAFTRMRHAMRRFRPLQKNKYPFPMYGGMGVWEYGRF